MTCESADSGDSADAAEGGQSHASKGKEQSEQQEMSYTPEQALQLQWTMRSWRASSCGAGAASVSVRREAESKAGAAQVPSGTVLSGGARGKVTVCSPKSILGRS